MERFNDILCKKNSCFGCLQTTLLCIAGETEFLKAAIMQSHNGNKKLRSFANVGPMNANQEKLAQMLYNYHILTMCSSFTCFVCHACF